MWPFFHWNLHDHGQPFSKTARLTCSYLYDFTWTVGTCTFSVQKVVGPKADQPDHFYIIMPLFMQHKSHQLPAPMHLKYKLITPTHYTYSQHLIPNVHLSVCKIIRNPTEYSPDWNMHVPSVVEFTDLFSFDSTLCTAFFLPEHRRRDSTWHRLQVSLWDGDIYPFLLVPHLLYTLA